MNKYIEYVFYLASTVFGFFLYHQIERKFNKNKNEEKRVEDIDFPTLDIKESDFIGMGSYIDHFKCPFTLDVLRYPLICKYGHSYERNFIIEWVNKHSTCPQNRNPLSPSEIRNNETLKDAIKYELISIKFKNFKNF